jgi:hypothetical protein
MAQPEKAAGADTAKGYGILAVVALLLVGYCTLRGNQDRAAQDARPTLAIGVDDIFVAFRDNPVAAQQRFKVANLLVSGTIINIQASSSGEPTIYLAAPHGRFAAVDFEDDEEAAVAVAIMRRGQQVVVKCRSVDEVGVENPFYDLKGCGVAKGIAK